LRFVVLAGVFLASTMQAAATPATSASYRVDGGQVETSGGLSSSASHGVVACIGAAVAGESRSASHTLSVGCGFALALASKLPQAITFGPTPTLAAGGAAAVTATGGASGNPVVFSSRTPATCSTGDANGSQVTGLAAGSCVIAANQAGNATYDAAPEVTQAITILATNVAGAIGGAVSGQLAGGSCAGFSFAAFEAAVGPPLPMPNGALRFIAEGCGVGGSVRVTLTYPVPLGPNAVLLKRGSSGWFTVDASSVPGSNVVFAGSTVSFTITDGGAGDVDGVANGRIEDPIGVGFNIPAEPVQVPTLFPWSLLALGIALFALVRRRLAPAN
jgi:hypothetical protein